jgi:hypothetical protein
MNQEAIRRSLREHTEHGASTPADDIAHVYRAQEFAQLRDAAPRAWICVIICPR